MSINYKDHLDAIFEEVLKPYNAHNIDDLYKTPPIRKEELHKKAKLTLDYILPIEKAVLSGYFKNDKELVEKIGAHVSYLKKKFQSLPQK